MRKFFRILQSDSVLNGSFWATVIIIILTLASIGIAYTNLPPFVPLYNQRPWGYARLGNTYELFIPPFVIICLCIFNSILGVKLITKAPLLARFLFITMAGLALFTCIFIGRLIFTTL